MGALLAHFLLRQTDAQPGKIGGHQKGGNALRAGATGPCHHREERCLVGVGYVALGAGQAVEVAIAHRLCLDRSTVGACAGLGERKAGDNLTGRDPRQPLGFLGVGARDDQALAADADIGSENRPESGCRPPQLQGDADFLGHGKAETAILLGDRQAE